MSRPRAVVEAARGLPPAALEQIAALERRVVDHDGGRLKLEWGWLRARSGERTEDVLAWRGDELVGFAGLYGPASRPEIAGMVDPPARRQGLGGELLDAVLGLLPADAPGPLLIVPRGSAGGRALAERRGATLDHTEHALILRGEPTDGPTDPSVTVRTAERPDLARITALLTGGFGYVPADLGERLAEPGIRTLVFERADAVIATMRVSMGDGEAHIYGFVVDPALRGRGIGRDVLRRVCRSLREEGAETVGLEVDVDNDRALGLYTSLGFDAVTTEDYWALAARR